jgi:hypothetical protein
VQQQRSASLHGRSSDEVRLARNGRCLLHRLYGDALGLADQWRRAVTSPQKRKGDAGELATQRHFVARGVTLCARIPAGATSDVGDLLLPIEFGTVDVKNYASYAGQLAHWTDRASEQADNAGRTHGVVVIKRTGITDPGRWYALTTLDGYISAITGKKP